MINMKTVTQLDLSRADIQAVYAIHFAIDSLYCIWDGVNHEMPNDYTTRIIGHVKQLEYLLQDTYKQLRDESRLEQYKRFMPKQSAAPSKPQRGYSRAVVDIRDRINARNKHGCE